MKVRHQGILNQLYHGYYLNENDLKIAKQIVHGLNMSLENNYKETQGLIKE
tara:strand:+ start:504 stop:656 length:153 start_codon:yes stop_codon:yes gene_type:complete